MKKKMFGILVFLFAILNSYIIGGLLSLLPKSTLKGIPEILIYLVMDFILIFVLCFIYRQELKDEWKLFRSDWKNYLENNVSYWVMGLVLMAFFNLLINNIIGKDLPENQQLINTMFKKMPVYIMFTTLIVAPLTEELIYRKTIKKIFKNEWVFVVMSGSLFGLAHIIYSYKEISDFLYIIPYGILGSAFAFMYNKTKTIFVPIAFHLFHNLLAVLMLLISLLL